jgi:hypothetical protein
MGRIKEQPRGSKRAKVRASHGFLPPPSRRSRRISFPRRCCSLCAGQRHRHVRHPSNSMAVIAESCSQSAAPSVVLELRGTPLRHLRIQSGAARSVSAYKETT